MGFWKRTAQKAPVMDHLSDRGRFSLAVRVYQLTGLSAEGHRHYPLRPVKALRRSPATCCRYAVSGRVGRRGGATRREPRSAGGAGGRCHKVQGQQGYYRAIAGMRAASPGAFDRAAARMPNAVQRLLRGAELRKLIDVPGFPSNLSMRQRTRTALATFSATRGSPLHDRLHSAMLLCPVRDCRMALPREERRLLCPRGHSFDVARSGYINLLQPQDRRSKRPGDTALPSQRVEDCTIAA